MNRRDFLKLSTRALAGVALAGGAAGLAESGFPRVRQQEVFLTGLAREFDGLTVALLSDFHHSAWITTDHIRRAVDLTNARRPDLVLLTGDYIHRGRQWVAPCFVELARLRARAGVFGVLGNHDHYDGAARACRDAMRRAGIVDLTNAGVDLRRSGSVLRLAGVGDLWREKQNLRVALGWHGKPESALVLSHNPDFTESVRDPRVGLIFSGHTHGGQVVLPVLGPPIVPSRHGRKYLSGLCQGPSARVFVTTGVGCSFPPVRWNCPSEIAWLTLRRAQILS